MSASTWLGVVVVALAIVFIYYIASGLPPTNPFSGVIGSLVNTSVNLTYPTTTTTINNTVPQNQTIAYALSLINQDRNKYGLSNVTLAPETSGQQHAQSMLQYHYFSHWDIFGLKPYMRYTLLGGRQAVSENVAYIYDSRGINVFNAISQMEYNMMYNDLQCCNNGHRDNILDPTHDQVSIGVAYNATTIYFDEDFIDNYTTWFYGTPTYSNGAVKLQGTLMAPYQVSQVEISYDPQVMNMTVAQLDNTSSYSYGNVTAGIGYTSNGKIYSFPGIDTINASTYVVQGQKFDIAFNMSSQVAKQGAGEYTVMLWITNGTAGAQTQCHNVTREGVGIRYCNNFLASTYTVFINNRGQQYTPQGI